MTIRCQVPFRCQRRNRSYTRPQGACSLGTSRRGMPVRTRNRMPSISCRRGHIGGLPGLLPLGNSGFSTAHCASLRSRRATAMIHFRYTPWQPRRIVGCPVGVGRSDPDRLAGRTPRPRLEVGRPPGYAVRSLLDVNRTGIPRRYLPHGYPHWNSRYAYSPAARGRRFRPLRGPPARVSPGPLLSDAEGVHRGGVGVVDTTR